MFSKTFVCPLLALGLGVCLAAAAPAQALDRNKCQIEVQVSPAEYDATKDLWTIKAPSVTSASVATCAAEMPLFVLIGPAGGRAPADASEVYDLFPGVMTGLDGTFSAPYDVPAWVAGLEFDLQIFGVHPETRELLSSPRLKLRAEAGKALPPVEIAETH